MFSRNFWLSIFLGFFTITIIDILFYKWLHPLGMFNFVLDVGIYFGIRYWLDHRNK